MEQTQNSTVAPQASAPKIKLTPVLTLLESAISVWWKNLAKFVGIYLWGLLYALIPLAIAGLLFGLESWLDNRLNLASSIAINTIIFLAVLLAAYFSIRAYAGIFLLVKKNYEGNEHDIFKEAKDYFWPYLGLAFLTAVFILLWTLLLIIPGIIYSIFYSFAVYAFFFEGKRGMAAIKRSVQLVKGYWWAIFGRFLLLGIVLWIFLMIISLPLAATTPGTPFYTIWNALVQVISFIIGPISLLFYYQIYQDLVKIKK